MRPWYRNSTLQMDDGEMEWLQSKDAASCAVWEWYKCDSQKRGDGSIRDLSEQEIDTVSRRLGIDSPRFSQISQNLHTVKWISQKTIRGWQKWQGARTPEEDAARKQAEYWKSKALEKNGLEKSPESLPISPKTSHSLPKPPLEENRGEQSIKPPIVPQSGKPERKPAHGDVYTPESRVVLHFLNEKSGKHFRESESSLAPINARLTESGVTIGGVKQMIARQCSMWNGTRMQEYLRPETLFGKTKFESYYAARELPVSISDKLIHQTAMQFSPDRL